MRCRRRERAATRSVRSARASPKPYPFPRYFVSLNSSRPISMRRISLVPWAIWPRPPLRDLTFAALMLASSDRPKVLFRFVEQLAADQHPADFRGSRADLIQLRIAPQAAGCDLVDVTVAAQRLDRLAGHPRRF